MRLVIDSDCNCDSPLIFSATTPRERTQIIGDGRRSAVSSGSGIPVTDDPRGSILEKAQKIAGQGCTLVTWLWVRLEAVNMPTYCRDTKLPCSMLWIRSNKSGNPGKVVDTCCV